MLTILFNNFVKRIFTALETAQSTELLIKETAKKLFFVEGQINATTQEIADAAGVNRTLLNYYFRSRDTLFNEVYKDTKEERINSMFDVLASAIPFKQKIENLIDILIEYINKYPYVDVFLISEMHKKNKLPVSKSNPKRSRIFREFLNDADEEIRKGNLRADNSADFYINLTSLISYPMMMKDLYGEIFKMENKDFDKINQKRKENILKLFFDK